MNKNNNLKPFFTIIMNCHNGEKYLKKSLNSLINQSYDNWELIFWDNKSNDNSPNIVNSYKDKRINYFLSERFTSNTLTLKATCFCFISNFERNPTAKSIKYFSPTIVTV